MYITIAFAFRNTLYMVYILQLRSHVLQLKRFLSFPVISSAFSKSSTRTISRKCSAACSELKTLGQEFRVDSLLQLGF